MFSKVLIAICLLKASSALVEQGGLEGLTALLSGLGGGHGHKKHDIQVPQPYKFGYLVKDKKGGHFREEVGDGKGGVKGSYGYKDAKGLYRNVDYVADKFGFRAAVKTNEPGTSNQHPAHVKYHHEQPPSHVYLDKGGHGLAHGLGGLGGHGLGGHALGLGGLGGHGLGGHGLGLSGLGGHGLGGLGGHGLGGLGGHGGGGHSSGGQGLAGIVALLSKLGTLG